MTNPYKLVVQLQQYAPLLHFQGETEGACLRASEVKPKLDRFLWDYFERHGIVPPESWQLKVAGEAQGGYKPALRYKMRFAGDMHKVSAHPLYFAQNMNEGAKAIALWSNRPIEMQLMSLCEEKLSDDMPLFNGTLQRPSLLEIIDKLLPAFFALHCFGARSGKGFGSFEVVDRAPSDEEVDFYKQAKCLKVYRLKSSINPYRYTQCQDDIFILSGLMKGGFNKPYHKGEVQTSLLPTYSSEKAFIKQDIFPHATMVYRGSTMTLLAWYSTLCRGGGGTVATTSSHRFLRAMLGLADHYSYGVGRSAQSIKVAARSADIKRFANPVRFKPCEDGFRIIVWEIPDALWSATFDFSYSTSSYPIQTPSKSEFDLVAFVDNFLSPLSSNPTVREAARTNHRWDGLASSSVSHISFSKTIDKLTVVHS